MGCAAGSRTSSPSIRMTKTKGDGEAVPEGSVKRSVRVSGRVREEISRLLARDLTDPRLLHAMITEVTMPDDLASARVKVRLAVGGSDGANRKRLLDGLRAAGGLIRKGVGRCVGLRRAPELRFEYDEGPDAAARIEELLAEIKREQK
jgi:ribosome-binding factor A